MRTELTDWLTDLRQPAHQAVRGCAAAWVRSALYSATGEGFRVLTAHPHRCVNMPAGTVTTHVAAEYPRRSGPFWCCEYLLCRSVSLQDFAQRPSLPQGKSDGRRDVKAWPRGTCTLYACIYSKYVRTYAQYMTGLHATHLRAPKRETCLVVIPDAALLDSRVFPSRPHLIAVLSSASMLSSIPLSTRTAAS